MCLAVRARERRTKDEGATLHLDRSARASAVAITPARIAFPKGKEELVETSLSEQAGELRDALLEPDVHVGEHDKFICSAVQTDVALQAEDAGDR